MKTVVGVIGVGNNLRLKVFEVLLHVRNTVGLVLLLLERLFLAHLTGEGEELL